MKIALAMIVKGTADEAPLLDRCLSSVKKYVDGIYVDVNAPKGKKPAKEVVKTAERHGADVQQTVWTGNFVQARRDNFARVPEDYDFILWLDSDDTLENAHKLRPVLAATPAKIDGLFIKYDYAHDEYGNATVSHWNARIVRNNGSFNWKASFSDGKQTVHETLNEVRKVNKGANKELYVKHHADNDRRDASLARNIELLEKMLDGSQENPDPRILFYLATHYVDAGRNIDAKELFEHYLDLSGWAEERAQAWTYLGLIYRAFLEPGKARGCYMRAVAENPKDPAAYVELAELEMRDQLWEKAIEWLEMAASKKPDLTAIISQPLDNTYRAYKLLSECYANLGGSGFETAHKWLKKALRLRPDDPELHEAKDKIDELLRVKTQTEAASTLLSSMRESEPERIPALCDALPIEMQENPLVISARNHYREPVVWPEKSVAIVCGWGPLGNWGPKSLDKGLGGSEEAVIRISRELAKLGYQVTVFGTPGQEAGPDVPGVSYRHYWEFNRKDTFDVLINWRNPEFFEEPVKARRSYLWLHDVMDKEEFTEKRLNNVDRIMFVSQYHRDLYPFIPEAKCFVTGNGITPEDFEQVEKRKLKRDPHRIVYMSSHLRGLELLYVIWPDVKKAVPEATLDVYYGWESYDAVNRSNPERMAWKAKMVDYERKLDGVTDHGRIGHDRIVEEIFKAGVWAYPCPFPEVYCITAVKAQAGGAVPVASNFAALDETVQHGTKITMKAKNEKLPLGEWDQSELEEFKQALIKMLKNPKTQQKIRGPMMEWARKEMSWEKTAQGWVNDFNRIL